MQVGFKTDRGMRRHNNEDACFILPSSKVYVVADGVGGGNAGEIASRTAVSQIAGYIDRNPMEPTEDKYKIANYFQHCLDTVNGHIYQMANKYDANRGMATTIVIVYAEHGKAYITNVGDSRAYLYRDGQLMQLTDDHTYVNTLVKAGILTPEEAEFDERKNVITKALGAEPGVEPDFFQVDILEDDIILMCSDGLYDEVSEDEIIEVLDESMTMSATCAELVNRANMNGGHDNITVVSLRVMEEDIDG